MTGTFSNHRISALPCERMFAKCIFAENFVSELLIEDNSGAGATSQHRGFELTSTGDKLEYTAVYTQAETVSVVIKFKLPSDVADDAILLVNSANSKERIKIYTYGGAIRATYANSVDFEVTPLESAAINDNEWHTITYIVNHAATTHTIYLDGNDAVTAAGSAGSIVFTPGFSDYLQIGGGIATGSIAYVRMFQAVLTEANHLDYYNEVVDLMDTEAVWRCDEICNDTVGNKILDKSTELNDLWLADKSTTASMPVFDIDKYELDGVDDYFSNFPTLSTLYTISAVISSDETSRPIIVQENDDAFLTTITTSGGYHGRLHNMQYFERELSDIQLKNAEYKQLYYISQVLARGAFARLAVEGTCKSVSFFGQSYRNWATPNSYLSETGVVTQSEDGVEFVSSSALVHAHSTELDLSHSGTIFIYGTINAQGVLAEKTGCRFEINGSGLLLNSSLHVATLNAASVAVTFSQYNNPRFYIDGVFVGEGSVSEDVSTSSSDLYIGNQVALGNETGCKLNHFYWGDEPLTDFEIAALHLQSQIIANNPIVDSIITIQDSISSTDIIQDSVSSTDFLQDIKV